MKERGTFLWFLCYYKLVDNEKSKNKVKHCLRDGGKFLVDTLKLNCITLQHYRMMYRWLVWVHDNTVLVTLSCLLSCYWTVWTPFKRVHWYQSLHTVSSRHAAMIHTAVLLLAAVSATHGFSEMKADMQAMFDDVQNDEHNFQSSRLAPSHLPLSLTQRVQQLNFYCCIK